MVRVESSFTLDQLKEFSQAKYPGFTSKSRAHVNSYPRQIASYIAIEAGYGYTQVARMINVTHPTVIFSKQRVYEQLMDKNEKFCKMYTEFVEDFNNYLKTNTIELPTTVNEGESVNA